MLMGNGWGVTPFKKSLKGINMRELRSEIEINAPLTKVWDILMDFDHWKDWNPIVNQARGMAAIGSKLSMTMRGKEGEDANQYMPIITQFVPPKFFRWRANMMAGFLFTNDKIFKLEERGAGTRLIHIEAFSGMLVPLFWSKLNKGVLPMLNSMNEALKKNVEKRASA